MIKDPRCASLTWATWLTLDGSSREVGPGDAVLTRDGSTHALYQRGDEDLVIFIVYRKRGAAP
ncbi:cupin domain-containing protein [Marilutibacter aestuarii]|uniref:Cupin domain-containing protein n=1 Tax=Marilutibacter aestuarii TaxID=1706195 RepID=A0A508AD01_9GAMM|nr:cupin domain-containing protein [Lysobacter aestuarii]TQD47736.1 cupin domain-containing protein [Lysobacter aestuarii]